jgi:hypothetical protein
MIPKAINPAEVPAPSDPVLELGRKLYADVRREHAEDPPRRGKDSGGSGEDGGGFWSWLTGDGDGDGDGGGDGGGGD